MQILPLIFAFLALSLTVVDTGLSSEHYRVNFKDNKLDAYKKVKDSLMAEIILSAILIIPTLLALIFSLTSKSAKQVMWVYAIWIIVYIGRLIAGIIYLALKPDYMDKSYTEMGLDARKLYKDNNVAVPDNVVKFYNSYIFIIIAIISQFLFFVLCILTHKGKE